jgi:GDPmannose 4,6-dehydratase
MHLDMIKQFSDSTRYYNAATSEMFGGIDCPEEGYNEQSPMYPRSPYAVSKLAAFHATRNYREAFGLHCVSGILFNHSSCRRGADFATRKITSTIANIKTGKEKKLKMGDLSSYRDEGSAEDYVIAMHKMLSINSPDDFVIATGKTSSIEWMTRKVCQFADISFEDIYELDERYIRPSDVPRLLGDATKANTVLNWKASQDIEALLYKMYINDLGKIK